MTIDELQVAHAGVGLHDADVASDHQKLSLLSRARGVDIQNTLNSWLRGELDLDQELLRALTVAVAVRAIIGHRTQTRQSRHRARSRSHTTSGSSSDGDGGGDPPARSFSPPPSCTTNSTTLTDIFNAHQVNLVQTAVSALGDADGDAQDAVADVWLKLCRTGRIPSVAELHVMVRNRCRDLLRWRRSAKGRAVRCDPRVFHRPNDSGDAEYFLAGRDYGVERFDHPAVAAAMFGLDQDRELQCQRLQEIDQAEHRVAGLMEALTAIERRVIQLHYLLELSQAEVGRRLGLTPPSVKSYVHRAKRRMRSNIGK